MFMLSKIRKIDLGFFSILSGNIRILDGLINPYIFH